MPNSPRIEHLYDRLINSIPSISTERSRIYTEAVSAAAGKPVILQRAYGFSRVLRQMQLVINEGELIVGNMTEKDRGAIVTPEFGWQWVARGVRPFCHPEKRTRSRLRKMIKRRCEPYSHSGTGKVSKRWSINGSPGKCRLPWQRD